MSQKEAKRGQVMELLSVGKVDQKEAGKMLAVSVRQISVACDVTTPKACRSSSARSATSLESAGRRNNQDNRDKDDR